MLKMWLQWMKKVFVARNLRRRFPHSVIHFGVTVDRESTLRDYCVLFCNANILQSVVGAYSYVQSNTAIYNAEIGSFCSIAGDVTIGLAAHPTTMVSTSPVFFDNKQPLPKFFTQSQLFKQTLPRTTIGADVWIGQGALVKAGVCIGVGAVIGAGSVVVKDILPYAIAVGNPCHPIRLRFSEDICQRLIESKWWELSEDKLQKLAPAFADPETFLTLLSKKND